MDPKRNGEPGDYQITAFLTNIGSRSVGNCEGLLRSEIDGENRRMTFEPIDSPVGKLREEWPSHEKFRLLPSSPIAVRCYLGPSEAEGSYRVRLVKNGVEQDRSEPFVPAKGDGGNNLVAKVDNEEKVRDIARNRFYKRLLYLLSGWLFVAGLGYAFFPKQIMSLGGEEAVVIQALWLSTVFFGFGGVIITFRLIWWQSVLELLLGRIPKTETGNASVQPRINFQSNIWNRDYYQKLGRILIMIMITSILVLGFDFVSLHADFGYYGDVAQMTSLYVFFGSVVAITETVYVSLPSRGT